ncbi:MAG: AsnC family transcriptional regulator [Desulfobacterales bacterium]|nr:AsnC family transcriptional regulator [Desulfobacterales bacterium]
MDDTDKRLLNRIQSDFPITLRPFQDIGLDLGLSENEVIQRLRDLKKKGIIRRIGGNFFPDKLGFVSTLCAASVPEHKIDFFTQVVNAFPGVTHNYQRDHHYNIWFTFIAPSRQEIEHHLNFISEQTGITEILNLYAKKLFKINAHFSL